MVREAAEDYLGAIYRLRRGREVPLPLSALQERLALSAMTVHEMVQRLVAQGWAVYHPYRGVTLTESGEALALALVRRHRLWERFLTDWLGVPWDEAHEVAGRLEHAAPETVTERLAQLMGYPDQCPHGGPIPPHGEEVPHVRLDEAPVGVPVRLVRVAPESAAVLRTLQDLMLRPGTVFSVEQWDQAGAHVRIEGRPIELPATVALALYVIPLESPPGAPPGVP